MTNPKCPHHPKADMYMMYGVGWDYDRWQCMQRDGLVRCDYEIELDVTSYPEDDLYNEDERD